MYHIMFKVWDMTIILSNLLLCAIHLMQGLVYEKRLQENRSFLTENPALVLSNVHKRKSARDCLIVSLAIRISSETDCSMPGSEIFIT
jgi:hypothetical protein